MSEREWHDEAMRLAQDYAHNYSIVGDNCSRHALAAHLRTRPSAEPPPVAQGEREAFETWMERNVPNWRLAGAQASWELWQAARAAAPKLRELSDGEIDEAMRKSGLWFLACSTPQNRAMLTGYARAVLAAAGKEKP